MPVTDSIESVSLERWRTLAPRFLDYSYQQCWAYAQALALRHHAASEHVAIVSGAEVLGLASVRVRTAPVLKCGIAYIASGPLTRRGWVSDIDRLGRCLRTLQEEYVERRGLVLRILAPLGSPEWNLAATAAFKEAGMTTTDRSRSYRTFLLDVSRTPDVIRTGCSKYWRRNLRRADRAKFTVHIGTTPELFDPMRSLYEQLRRRKQFESALDADFYAGLQPQLDPGEQFTAGLIEMDGEPVAGLVWSMLGDTCVPLLLAADESGLLSYAVYLLQWRSIVDAHERGMRYYDLGGIDPETNVGVYNFRGGALDRQGRDHAQGGGPLPLRQAGTAPRPAPGGRGGRPGAGAACVRERLRQRRPEAAAGQGRRCREAHDHLPGQLSQHAAVAGGRRPGPRLVGRGAAVALVRDVGVRPRRRRAGLRGPGDR
ncbi:MAG: lipid II:glycine glycyltransferase FemX [Planctomycetota bacterium]|jgi:hypothetical protein